MARRVLGQDHIYTLQLTLNYAKALYRADGATLDDLREAVEMLEKTKRTARRVLGGANRMTQGIEFNLQNLRTVLRAREKVRETPPTTKSQN